MAIVVTHHDDDPNASEEVVPVSNHRRLDYLLNRLFRSTSKKTPKLRVTCLCKGYPCGCARWIPLTKGQ